MMIYEPYLRGLLTLLLLLFIAGAAGLPNQADERSDLSSGLVAYWKFDEGKGEIASDATLNRNNATLEGPTWVEGRYNFAVQLDGLDDYIRVADGDSLNLGDQFTIAAWVSLSKVGEGRQTLVQKAASYTFYVQWTADLLALIIGDGERRVGLLSDRGLGTAGEWHHVAVTFSYDADDGQGRVLFYINGQPAGEDFVTLAPSAGSGHLNIGRRAATAEEPKFHLNGALDELFIYDRALSSPEIERLFQLEESLNLPPIAGFTISPQDPTIDDLIQFTDLSQDPDGYIVYWGWDFGNGAVCPREPSSCGEGSWGNPTHRYATPGTYRVKLTVIDNQGALSRVTKQIEVFGD